MANSVSFSGLGSGIDFNTIRDAILTQRSRPITQLQTKANDYTNRSESLKQLNAALAAVTTAAQALTSRDLGTGRSATTGDANIATATATAQANLGGFDLNVTRLATTLTQASRSFAATDTPVIAGNATSATFELRKGGATTGIEIKLDETNNTLTGLRDAINAKNAGVTAAIVDINGDGSNQQLVLSSKDTGASGRVELVETSATGTGADLNLRSLNPPDGDFTKLDAALTINGLSLTRATNNISDAVTGVTLALKKTGATNIGITQAADIDNKLRGFINAYNGVQDFIAGQYKKDSKNRPTGILAGDPTLRNVQQQLRESLGALSENNGGVFNSLAQVGITTSDDGHLAIDSTVLGDKLKTNSDDVRALLFGKAEGKTGIFQRVFAASNGLSDSVTGSVQTAITGYQSSVKTFNDTISNRLEGINRLRDSLSRRFAAADAAIGQLNGQGTSLTSIIKSLDTSNNK